MKAQKLGKSFKTHLIASPSISPRCGHMHSLYEALRTSERIKNVNCVKCRKLFDHDSGKAVYRMRKGAS